MVKYANPHEHVIINHETGCWDWQGRSTNKGYGMFTLNRTTYDAHVWFYQEKFGTVPDGLVLHHRCENRMCVNPEHLVPMTRRDHCRIGGMSKITMKQADEIKALRPLVQRGSDITAAKIADRYGISKGTVHDIWQGNRWHN